MSGFFSRLPETEYVPSWYTLRENGGRGPHEQAAARKSVIHADTPSVTHADSLGRTFLTITHNRLKYSDTLAALPDEEFYSARIDLDIEGNQRGVRDPKDRIVMKYDYDLLGKSIHEVSMEAGERWMLSDVLGSPLYAWDSRAHRFRTTYDSLRRPTETFVSEAAGAELLVGRTTYGEAFANPEAGNLRTRVVKVFDQAGVVTSDEYDFKGNSLRTQRELARNYKTTLDWAGQFRWNRRLIRTV